MTLIPHNALIVVADGGGAILLRNAGKPGAISLREERRLEPNNLDNDGPSGSRPGDQTQSQTDEATFAKQLSNAINKMKLDGEFEKLVLIADPQTLGQMRPILHKTVEASLIRSLAKDLTNHSFDDIAEAIAV
ncbi:host attachment family protein [Rhodopseudomonas pseudopalustris]|uniref:Protein required for attachment to host cells n=2 Tax=Rhodopseudomonas TaxID=1073 RepID=A0A1H8SAQ8_9BRAD|nr:host attachment family protein [Rhodopseudomonas pseudopalustris]ABE39336.1 putative AtsE [Rhodopseudomonas palustris BisB5]MBB1090729.1 host attachment protein [Rhodopseudomonas palustris]SEO75675.1 Protein required for attachment to host cells [Rhodopseudomonas pseudopalustris]